MNQHTVLVLIEVYSMEISNLELLTALNLSMCLWTCIKSLLPAGLTFKHPNDVSEHIISFIIFFRQLCSPLYALVTTNGYPKICYHMQKSLPRIKNLVTDVRSDGRRCFHSSHTASLPQRSAHSIATPKHMQCSEKRLTNNECRIFEDKARQHQWLCALDQAGQPHDRHSEAPRTRQTAHPAAGWRSVRSSDSAMIKASKFKPERFTMPATKMCKRLPNHAVSTNNCLFTTWSRNFGPGFF